MKLKDYYRYKITLEDGSVIEQETPGSNTGFKFNNENPDFKRIKSFELIPVVDGIKPFKLLIPKCQQPTFNPRLIWFKRTVGGLDFPQFHIYIIGWQLDIKVDSQKYFWTPGFVNIKQISYIYPDGYIENSDEEPKRVEEFIKKLRYFPKI